MRDAGDLGNPRRMATAILAALLCAVVTVGTASGQGAASPQPHRTADAAPVIPAKLNCAALVQDGATRNMNVPDFQEIPGAPTRITSAKVVAATDMEPEYCEITATYSPRSSFS